MASNYFGVILNFISNRWKALILRDLMESIRRFDELRK